MDGLDRLNRNFLRGSIDAAKKIHWVGWEKVMKPKEEGGLGLQIAKGRNVALLAKLNWRFHTEREAPWVRVLKMKYCSQRRREATNADTLPCSSTWSAMKKGVDTFNKGSRWLVTKNSNLNIWHNNWTNGGSLRKLIQGPISQETDALEVKDFMLDVGWDWKKLTFDLTDEIKGMISAIPISTFGGGSNTLTWAGSPKGVFDVKAPMGLLWSIQILVPFQLAGFGK